MLNIIFRHFASAGIEGFQSRSLHSYVLAHLTDSVVDHIGLHINQHADLSAHMSVVGYKSVCLLDLGETADLHILSDHGDLSCQFLGNGLGGVKLPRLCQESVDVRGLGLHGLVAYLRHVSLEFLVLGNEIGLRVYFYCNGLLGILGHLQHDDAFGRDSAGLLLSGSQSLLSQELNCLVHIAIGSGQGLFAVHHTGAGHFS